MKVTPFANNDDGYFAWLQKNPGGFVVHAQKGTPPKPIRLHRTRCGHISKEGLVKGGQYTEGRFLSGLRGRSAGLEDLGARSWPTDGWLLEGMQTLQSDSPRSQWIGPAPHTRETAEPRRESGRRPWPGRRCVRRSAGSHILSPGRADSSPIPGARMNALAYPLPIGRLRLWMRPRGALGKHGAWAGWPRVDGSSSQRPPRS